MTLLAIDIGGSGSRLRARGGATIDLEGPALAVTGGRPDYQGVLDALGAGVTSEEPTVVSIGAAGLLSLGEPSALAQIAAIRWPRAHLVIVPDVVGALASIGGLDGGVIVAAGTGAIGLGTDFGDRWVRSDGWGHLLGDAGSGAWIGARGLDVALRRRDGRAGGSDLLLAAAQEQFGDLARLPSLVRSSSNEATVLASFAPSVGAAAEHDDAIAQHILAQAGQHLAETALSLLSPGLPERVALVGGVTEIGPALTGAFERTVTGASPTTHVVVGGGRVIDGLELLAVHHLSGRLGASREPYLTVLPASPSHSSPV